MINNNSFKSFAILKEVLLAIGVIVFLFIASNHLTMTLEANNPEIDQHTTIVTDTSNQTSESPRTTELTSSFHPVIVGLGRHEAALNQFVGRHVMVFTGMPVDEYNAIPLAHAMANDLKEFQKHGLIPMIIVEPDSSWGLLDFREFQQGLYEKGIRRYFEILKEEGIEENMLGIWIPFPEPNVPNWNHSESTPADYGAAVNTYITQLRSVYPSASTGILLNSLTYEPNDETWDTGQFLSLIPYVQHIQPGLVDWVGLQGFPWTPRAGQTATPIHDAAQFLSASMIEEAAMKLNSKRIWFNTGTYSAKYTNESRDLIVLNTNTRASIAQSIVRQVLTAKEQDYDVIVNIFAEDKSNTPESTDWSYLANPNNNSDQLHILSALIADFQKGGVTVSFFDK